VSAVKQPVQLQRIISKTKLSPEYMAYVTEAKRILNGSKIERHLHLLHISNPQENLDSKLQAMIIRIVNFSNKGARIIVFNHTIIYTPDYLITCHNHNFVDEVNQYFVERSTAKKVDSMLSWANKPLGQ